MEPGNLKMTCEELRVLLETGFVLREASRFADAEAVFLGCAELMPDSEVPLVGLGTVFLQKGDYQRAIDLCRKAFVMKGSSAYARLHLGEALIFDNQLEEACEHLNWVVSSGKGSNYAETAARVLLVAGLS